MVKKIKHEKPYSLVFSDSLLMYLSLIPEHFNTNKFAGKTMKGISKPDSPVRKKIFSITNKHKHNDIEYIIFSFGNVDLHLSFYYDMAKKPEYEGLSYKNAVKIWKEKTEIEIEKHIKVFKNLKTSAKKAIVAVHPSTIDSNKMREALIKYIQMDINELPADRQKLLKESFKLKNKHDRYVFFRETMRKYCKKNKIKYVSIHKYVLTKKNKVKKDFLDGTGHNIHLTWEPILKTLIHDPFFNSLGVKQKYIERLEKEQKEYIELKKYILDRVKVTDPNYLELKNVYVKEFKEKKAKGEI